MAGKIKSVIKTTHHEVKHTHTVHCHHKVQSVHLHHGSAPRPYDGPPSFIIPPNCADLARNLPSMSTEWKTLPFAFPNSGENQDKINEILTFSLRQQKEYCVSDNAGFVHLVVNRCLNAVGIENSVMCGFRNVDDESFPHVWLDIQGYVIDNTYIKELQDHKTQYLCKHTPQCYERCRFVYPEMQKPPPKPNTPLDTTEVSNTLTKKRIDFYMHKPDEALALGLNREQSRNYYFEMIRHMYDTYKVVINGIDPKIRFVCWGCECYPTKARKFLTDIVPVNLYREVEPSTNSKTSWRFSQCSRCMVANYCSIDCQKKDWFYFHSIVCLSRGSDYLPPLGDIPFMPDPCS